MPQKDMLRSQSETDTFISSMLPLYYKTIDELLYGQGGLYGVVRSGLGHEYFIKRKYRIELDSTPLRLNCGVIYRPTRLDEPEIIFCVKQYFEDLMKA
jgi:hypothetical protein